MKYFIHSFILVLFIVSLEANDKLFVACEGNFYEPGSGSLAIIDEFGNVQHIDNLGSVVNSVMVFEDRLFVLVNDSSEILVYDIFDDGIYLAEEISTDGSGPREMIVYNRKGFITNWYSMDIKVLDLDTLEFLASIPVNGLPEDIINHGESIWATVPMNSDWSNGNTVLKINPINYEIVSSYDVGAGPQEIVADDNYVYVSKIWYDDSWNAFHGTSRIDSQSGDVLSVNYGAGIACAGGIVKFNNQIYRSFDGGIAPIDNELNIITSERIGDYGYWNVYSLEVIDDKVYFGLSDYTDPDYVAVVDENGNEVGYYEVNILPGDFSVWNSCTASGDMNNDNELNISDIIIAVDNIIDGGPYSCSADLNEDGNVDILDIILMVENVLNLPTDGAINWLRYHFPKLQIEKRMIDLDSRIK